MLIGRRQQVPASELVIAERFKVESQIEPSVKLAKRKHARFGLVAMDRIVHVPHCALTAIQPIDFHHRNPPVVFDRQHLRSRLLQSVRRAHAKETPNRVLNIIVMVGLIEFELLGTFAKLPRVITGDATLPLSRCHRRTKSHVTVKVCDGLTEFAQPKSNASAMVISRSELCICLDCLR